MISLLNKLKEICTSYPFTEKRLVVDSYRTGEQILHAYTKQGNHAMNIKIMTLHEVAKASLEQYSSKLHELITPQIGSFLTYSLLKKAKEEKKLQYFHELEISPNLSRSIYQSIQTLRLSGITRANLPETAFSTPNKARDYEVILQAYEEMLKEKQLWDPSFLYEEVIKYEEAILNQNIVYIFQPNLSFLELEEQLVAVLLKKQSHILPIAPVFGTDIPKRLPFIRDAVGEPTSLSFLYEEKKQEMDKKELELFSGVTEESEISEVFRRMKGEGIPFDSAVLLYSNPDPYNMIIYQTAEQLNIPITFGEGLPITLSRPGKLVSGIMSWIKNQYPISIFISLIQEGIIDFGKDAPSQSSIMAMLRKSEIGWGRERYHQLIQKQIAIIKEKMSHYEGEKKAYFQKLEAEYIWLNRWLTKLFNHYPPMENNVMEYKGLINFFKYVVENVSRIQSPMDDTAKNALLEKMDAILPFETETLSSYEALLQIEDLLLSSNIGASGPKPGSVHVTSYKNGTFIDRSYLFFIGFDHQRFPGKIMEDPLLLDHERRMLHPNLPLAKEKSKENIYALLQLMASTNGHVTISYNYFDQAQNRPNNPSHFFLKCYRYSTGESDADFETITTKFNNYSAPVPIIDQKEWWQTNLNQKDAVLSKTFLMNNYHHIAAGEKAKLEKESGRFTEYEGNIKVEESALDPRKSKEIRMSSGRLEKLAACPYKYFLEDVLKVSPPETVTYDPNVWLDAKTRGILLHEIFEQFYKSLQAETPSYEKHKKLLLAIANERIMAYRERLAPPSQWVFEQEENEIIDSCRIFLKSEEEHGSSARPIHFEYSFGIGETPTAEILLRDGESFPLSGKIDRVDQDLDSNLSIIDYKTGKASKYDMTKYFNGGRQLQHFLYANALESHMKLEAGTVKTSSYLFPTVKGTGERRERNQDQPTRANGLDIVERLLDILKYGHFTMTDNVKVDCTYCDYKHVCKRSSYSEEVFEGKSMDPEAEGVKRWKGVRAYE